MSGGIARSITDSDEELTAFYTHKRNRIQQEHEALESEIEAESEAIGQELSRRQNILLYVFIYSFIKSALSKT